jgi:hypothetical protein
MHRSDAGTSLDAAAEVALLQATIQSSRQIGRGLTHDLTAALQTLSEALFDIRDDAERLTEAHGLRDGGSDPTGDLATSLRRADEAYDRLAHVARVLPGLVLQPIDRANPIDLTAELLDLVGLTWHYWHDQVDVLVEVDPKVELFWCPWWIVRHVVLRLLVSAIAAQRARAGDAKRATTSRVRLVGARRGGEIVLRVVSEATPFDGAASHLAIEPAPDPMLVSCAERLDGTLAVESIAGGGSQTTLCFPVHVMTNARAEMRTR